jgi:hypothetical protein
MPSYRDARGHFISEAKWLANRRRLERAISRHGQSIRQDIRNRDRSRNVETRAKWQQRIDIEQLQQRGQLKRRGKMERQGSSIPKGRRVEITLRFRDTDPMRRRRQPTRLRMLKVQATITKKGITKAQVERALEDAVRSGRKTPGVQLTLANWEAGRDAVVKGNRKVVTHSGSLMSRGGKSLREQLRPFVGLFRKGAIKSSEVARVGTKRAGRGRAKSPGRKRAR